MLLTLFDPGSLDYLRQLGSARWVVSANILPSYFRKKRATTYLQTWHGTPLKRIAFDVERPQFVTGTRYFRQLRREVDLSTREHREFALVWIELDPPNIFPRGR